MAKIAESVDENAVADNIQPFIQNLAITTEPVLICGVQRKANIGNFENVDIYAAVALPTGLRDAWNLDALTERLEQLAEYGFKITSTETATRYRKVSVIAKAAEESDDPTN